MKAREDLGNCKICLNLICLDAEGVYAFALTPYTSSLPKVGETSQMRTISRKIVKALCLQSLRVELG